VGEDASPVTAARAALAAHSETRTLASAEFHPLAGGLANHTWRADSGGASFAVRLNALDDAALGVDRESEAALITVASAAGLAPEVVLCDAPRRLLVTRFVPGAVWTRDDARLAQNIERMADVLARLHRCPAAPRIARRSFREQARRLERTARDSGVPPDRELERVAEGVLDRLDEARRSITPCHCDVHHLNVIDDGATLTLIDWEYGGLGNPCFDLAAFISCHELDDGQRALLVAAYRGPADAGQLDDVLWVFDYVQWLWYRAAAWTGDRATRATFGVRAAEIRARL